MDGLGEDGLGNDPTQFHLGSAELDAKIVVMTFVALLQALHRGAGALVRPAGAVDAIPAIH